MIPSTTNIDIPVTGPQPAATRHPTPIYVILLKCLDYILKISARAIRAGIVVPVRHMWAYCYPRVVFMEEHVVMPRSALAFVIGALIAFAEIKAQGQPGFPFTTHPHLIRVSINSVLTYGLACAIELIVSAIGLDRTSFFAIIARMGKIGSLCTLAVSLACLFYL